MYCIFSLKKLLAMGVHCDLDLFQYKMDTDQFYLNKKTINQPMKM